MPAGSNPDSLILTLKGMARSLPVSTLQSVTLETMPFLMRCAKGDYELLVDSKPSLDASDYVHCGLTYQQSRRFYDTKDCIIQIYVIDFWHIRENLTVC